MALSVLSVAAILLLLVEVRLAATWSSRYFSSGIPLFRKEVPCAPEVDIDRIEEDLNLSFERRWVEPMTFRSMGDGRVVFRERFWPPVFFSYYFPLMHGFIERAGPDRVTVNGRSNWGVPSVLVVIALRVGLEAAALLPIWIAFIVAMYLLQAFRYREIAATLRVLGA